MRKGYMNKVALELGHADGEEHSRWKEKKSTALGHKGKEDATVVLTGNPGGPGTPSGPCDMTKTKQVV